MERALARGTRGRAAVVGCDIPDLANADVAAAFHALGAARACFGPAQDGGYWLVALGPLRPARPFARVRWSTEHALADTLANFRRHRVALLRTLRDVDRAADLEEHRSDRQQPADRVARPDNELRRSRADRSRPA
jgi:hypothetical protein